MSTLGTAPQNESDDDWCVDCSDDEKYGVMGKGDWYIRCEDIIKMFESLDKDKVLKLQWECPGMKRVSPSGEETPKEDEDELLECKPEEKSDFDFSDEMSVSDVSSLPTRRAQPVGSARKKTTSLDGVLSNMRRHRQIAAGVTAPLPETTAVKQKFIYTVNALNMVMKAEGMT